MPLLSCLVFPQSTVGNDDLGRRVHGTLNNTPLTDGHNEIPWLHEQEVIVTAIKREASLQDVSAEVVKRRC